VLFRYVFGGAINTGGVDYVDFLMPGIMVQTAIFSAP
jgi:ABC-2 type transport system permease protein